MCHVLRGEPTQGTIFYSLQQHTRVPNCHAQVIRPIHRSNSPPPITTVCVAVSFTLLDSFFFFLLCGLPDRSFVT